MHKNANKHLFHLRKLITPLLALVWLLNASWLTVFGIYILANQGLQAEMGKLVPLRLAFNCWVLWAVITVGLAGRAFALKHTLRKIVRTQCLLSLAATLIICIVFFWPLITM